MTDPWPHGGTFALVVVVVALTVGGGLAAVVDQHQQVVVTDDTGDTLLTEPVGDDDQIVLEYTHSVEKTTVQDVYVVQDGGLALTAMEFSSYGAGLPSTAPVNMTDSNTFIYDITVEEPGPVRVSTGEIADHDLIVAEERFDLADRADNETVIIRVERTVGP